MSSTNSKESVIWEALYNLLKVFQEIDSEEEANK